ncbi:AAA family ATPase [Saliterribacillus persicus]|uniref:MoxR-like ATPase n=1 Tax=Saliterribacillus persicus TaxID=930114 RepID=A0A368XH67_9BACI|nr:MoxR family ATPase [Saliterribacillus persicus]RCW65827.1 MoxR-like ATPase [Saliterribacillus persicus]
MEQEMSYYQDQVSNILANIRRVMIGKDQVTTLSLVAFLAEGHVLLEDVPGVGKTMLVRAMAKSLNCNFKRIQFTPDLLPSDVTGVSIYNPKELEFEFRSGPIFGDIVLADEINRTSPKTQSALLEAMEEMNVTVDGMTKSLEKPFFVMATQNPVDYEGTYPLPEAQLDRFLLKLRMGYPNEIDELEMLNRTDQSHPIEEIQAVMQKEELLAIQELIEKIYIDRTVKKYIIQIVTKTRSDDKVQLGASPRGSIALMKAAKAYAFVQNRDYVIPDDIKYLAPFVLAHRLILNPEAKYEGTTADRIIHDILTEVEVPITKEYSR